MDIFFYKACKGLYCIDFDNYQGTPINSYKDQSFLDGNELYDKLNKSGCYKSKTNKGYHFYVYIHNLKYSCQQKVGNDCDYEIDLLKGNNIWSPKDRGVIGKEVIYDWDDLKCYFNVSKMNFGHVPIRAILSPLSRNDDSLCKICNLIDISYLDNRDSWIRIVWGLKNDSLNNKELARNLSKKSSKYEDSYFEKLWSEGRSGNSLGSVLHYVHSSNPQKYF